MPYTKFLLAALFATPLIHTELFASDKESMSPISPSQTKRISLFDSLDIEAMPSSLPLKVTDPEGRVIYLLGTIHKTHPNKNYNLPKATLEFIRTTCPRVTFESQAGAETNFKADSNNLLKEIHARYIKNLDNQMANPVIPNVLREGIDDVIKGLASIEMDGMDGFIFTPSYESLNTALCVKVQNNLLDNLMEGLKKGMLPSDIEAINNIRLDDDENIEKDISQPIVDKNPVHIDSSFIDPIDVISWAVYSEFIKSIHIAPSSRDHISPGTEDIITSRLQNESKVVFSNLENTSSLYNVLRTNIELNTDPLDPYTKWVNALKASEEETPYFLTRVLEDSLAHSREAAWIPQMQDAFLESVNGNGVLFAIGNAHIERLSRIFIQKGCSVEAVELLTTDAQVVKLSTIK